MERSLRYFDDICQELGPITIETNTNINEEGDLELSEMSCTYGHFGVGANKIRFTIIDNFIFHSFAEIVVHEITHKCLTESIKRKDLYKDMLQKNAEDLHVDISSKDSFCEKIFYLMDKATNQGTTIANLSRQIYDQRSKPIPDEAAILEALKELNRILFVHYSFQTLMLFNNPAQKLSNSEEEKEMRLHLRDFEILITTLKQNHAELVDEISKKFFYSIGEKLVLYDTLLIESNLVEKCLALDERETKSLAEVLELEMYPQELYPGELGAMTQQLIFRSSSTLPEKIKQVNSIDVLEVIMNVTSKLKDLFDGFSLQEKNTNAYVMAYILEGKRQKELQKEKDSKQMVLQEEQEFLFRVVLTCSNLGGLESFCLQILQNAAKLQCKASLARLPQKRLSISVRKSPCGQGTNTWERWELRLYKRVIRITCTMDELKKILDMKLIPKLEVEVFKSRSKKLKEESLVLFGPN